ncbi:MAG: four helix bundle protein [Clostridia bacterium]|nr:four helix bundle protein [Clostridia bacterium]
MKESVIENKSFQFAIRIVNLYKYLVNVKKEFVMSKQLLKSGTSIGANVSEAEQGQSTADFHSKMCIGLKEANETYYWLRLLYATEYIGKKEFCSMENDIKELIALATSICKTTQEKMAK